MNVEIQNAVALPCMYLMKFQYKQVYPPFIGQEDLDNHICYLILRQYVCCLNQKAMIEVVCDSVHC